MPTRLAALVAALAVAPLVYATPGECTAKSGPGTVALVELYTSEGCDSCPPADAWLRKLPAADLRPGAVVPLSFHVDYWDYIGWKDPFASPAFGARQRELAAITRNRIVYTPQVMLAGRDYRGWASGARFRADVRGINATPARAEIALALRAPPAGSPELRVSATVPRAEDRADAALYVAVYENGLSNKVTAGENRGATLNHDFVVREWWGPNALDRAGTAELVRAPAARGLANGGVAAFVQSRRTGEVLQALALPACRG
jgi:hypothetical protein